MINAASSEVLAGYRYDENGCYIAVNKTDQSHNRPNLIYVIDTSLDEAIKSMNRPEELNEAVQKRKTAGLEMFKTNK